MWPTDQLIGKRVPVDTHRSEPDPGVPHPARGYRPRKEAETQRVYVPNTGCKGGELQVTVTAHDWIKICRKHSLLEEIICFATALTLCVTSPLTPPPHLQSCPSSSPLISDCGVKSAGFGQVKHSRWLSSELCSFSFVRGDNLGLQSLSSHLCSWERWILKSTESPNLLSGTAGNSLMVFPEENRLQ